MPVGKIDVNYELCVGCRLCAIACSLTKASTVMPSVSRIKVLQFYPGPLDIPVLCHQCLDRPCQAACPPKVSAISVDKETNATLVNDKCVGVKCSKCVKACPHTGAIAFHPSQKRALICDLCGGEPQCVKVCPTKAIAYMPGSSFDGQHYAVASPQQVAASLAYKFYPARRIR